MIHILIRRMTAMFGKLQGTTLELEDGLNIIQAPNETGKSTWCAFLLSMLYGINSRQRDKTGAIADKNRYAPWNGAAMSGRLDCQANGQNITLLRTTKRGSAPMGEFQALYTNTGDTVPELTGGACGEQLLGVTREVYARSAFICQNGLPIQQSAELERRIAALISSGDESSSYSEVFDLLKKQANRRRHNRTGEIPALESELQQLQQQFTKATTLSDQILLLRRQEQSLTRQEEALQQELHLHQRWAQHLRNQQHQEAEAAVAKAQQHFQTLLRQLEADHIPENDAIARLRGAIVNLSTAHRSLEKARNERDEAMKVFLRAEAAANSSPFAGETAEAAWKAALTVTDSKPWPLRELLLPLLIGLAALPLVISAILNGTGIGDALLYGVPCVLIALFLPFYKHRQWKKQRAAVLSKHGAASAAELHQQATAYGDLLQRRDAAQSELDKRSAAADTLYNSISTNEQAILLEIRRFAPTAYDLSSADALLRGCAIRRKEAADAESALREATLRRDILSHEVSAETDDVSPPHRPQAETTAELEEVSAALAECRNAIQQLSGQMAVCGDAAQLQTEIQGISQQLAQLQCEYDALQLATEALDQANQIMQNRFAPALGKRTAQLFHQLTDGRYQNVVLDRSLHLSAEPAGDHIYRDSALLSAGATDQLYLAARLAICETVLPAENRVPIVLDDALANFDDHRCAEALRLLKELARDRQILLFTCHQREAHYFADDKEVTILQLTNDGERV